MRSLAFVVVLGALLAVLCAGCANREGPPPEVGRWPMASALSVVAPVQDVAWVSASNRSELQGSWRLDSVCVPGRIQAICRVPATGYQLQTNAPIRVGFLVFHENGVCYCSSDDNDAPVVRVPVDPPLLPVRAAVCITPHAGNTGEVVALITGGETPPQAPEEPAEPPPWVTCAEVQLAWMRGGALITGPPEALAGTNPWALRGGKFAGEQDNLLVFVYTKAPFDQVTRRRPWIYRVVEGDDGLPHLDPRWRGTSFSRPFRDAVFGDFTGADVGEIAALELTEEGERLLTAYRFEGFGLEGIGQSSELPGIEDRVEAADWVGGDADELVVRTTAGRFLFFTLDPDAGELRQVLAIDGPATVLGWIITGSLGSEPGALICVLPDGEVWRTDSSQVRTEGA